MPSNAIILVFWRLSFKIAFLLSSFTFIRGSLFPLYFMPLVRWYRCESWSINKAECQRIDALQLWCWRKLLKVPWTARRSNQSILKEISPEYSLEGLMLMLKLQHCGHLIWRTNSLEKTLMLGKIEGNRRRGWQRMRRLDSITNSMDVEFQQALGDSEGQGSPMIGSVHGVTKS